MCDYALVDASGVVQNVVVWYGNTEEWQPPEGMTAVEVTETTGSAYIGGMYANCVFAAPVINEDAAQ